MRVVGNYGTSLFDYINSDKSIKEVFSKGTDGSLLSSTAKKTLKEKGITFNSSSSTDVSVYETIQDSTEDLRTSIAVLTNNKENSLYSEAEDTGDTSKLVKEVKEFVSSYNAMSEAIKKMGGSDNSKYLNDMDSEISKNSELFKRIGITKAADGLLEIDDEVISGAELSHLKEAFCNNEHSLDIIAQKSIHAEANAISAKYSAAISGYTSTGGYSDFALGSFIESI